MGMIILTYILIAVLYLVSGLWLHRQRMYLLLMVWASVLVVAGCVVVGSCYSPLLMNLVLEGLTRI